MATQYENWNAGIIDSDDDDEAEEQFYNSRDATLFLLEATDSMLEPSLAAPDASAPAPTQPSATQPTATQPSATQTQVGWKGKPARSKMELCLRSAFAMMKRKVFSAPKDSVGIVIFNTAEEKGSGDSVTKNCYYLLDLAQPDADNIRKMKDLLTQVEEDPDYLRQLFAPNKGQNMIAEAFGVASTIFRSRASKLSSKNILLVTDNDDPVGESEQLLNVAMNRRRDLHDMGYSLTPFLIPPSDSVSFDVDKFYGDIITLRGEEADAPPFPTVEGNLMATLDGMVASMRTKEATKRSAFSIPFILGKDFVIGVNGYQLVGEEKKKPPVKVDLNTAQGEEVISKTVYKDAESGAPLDPKKEIKKYFEVGKSDIANNVQATKVFFEESEVRKIKTLGRSPAIRLVGFKPREEYLRFHETIKHSYFLYPNEDMYSGSTRTFASLLQTMVDKKKIAIASFLPRVSARPQMVILFPQEEKLNEYGMAICPPGIHVCQLPFADDIRHLALEGNKSVIPPVEDDMDVDEDVEIPAVEQAKKIVKYLNRTYVPESYPNPALNHFYDTLAAIALDEELPEPEDKTIPSYNIIDKKLGKYIQELKGLIKEDEVDMSAIATSTKRRKIEKDPNEPLPDASEFIADYKKRQSKMKVDELKAGLKQLGLPMTGKKQDLLDRIDAELEKRGDIKDSGGGGDGNEGDSEEDMPAKKKTKRASKKVVYDEDDDDF
ncbi:Ku DNA-binding complex, Ku70 subunit [Meredithblackwellia eburnea MCA 4105]